MPIWVTLLAALMGAVVGALLRPFAEEFFEKRQKTLRIDLREEERESSSLPYPDMQIVWHGETYRKFIEQPFTVSNRTGRTLRNVNLDMEMNPSEEIGEEKILFDIVIYGSDGAKYEEGGDEKAGERRLAIQYLEPKAILHGVIVSTCEGVTNFSSPDDVELKVVRSRGTAAGERMVNRLIAPIALALGFISVFATTAPVEKLMTSLRQLLENLF